MMKLSFFRKQYDGDVLSYDPGSLIMEWKSEFDLDKTPPKLEKIKPMTIKLVFAASSLSKQH
jgi:hypothetical protein